MFWLKQSTAVTIVLGPFVDNTDGFTAETALTLSQADIRLSKNGAAFAQASESTSASHMENGYYSKPLDTTDTGTLGRLKVAVNETGALPVWADFLVLPANIYDSLISGSGTDRLQVDVQEWIGVAPNALSSGRVDSSVGAMANNVLTAAAINADAITAAKVAADVTTEIQSGLATAAALATVQADTDDIQTRLPAALVSGRMDSSVGAMAANVMTAAAAAADLTTELQSGLATAAALATVDDFVDTEVAAIKAVTDKLDTALELDGAVYRYTTNALEQSPAGGGGAPTAAAVADAVWDEALAGHVVAGSAGQALSSAGGAADPLLNTVPGAYAAGTAGYALGTLPSGVGAVRYVYTVHSGSDTGPLLGAGVTVWVSTDSIGDTVVAGPLITNDLSQVTFFLDIGTYYFWRQKSGWNFTNPDQEQVV